MPDEIEAGNETNANEQRVSPAPALFVLAPLPAEAVIERGDLFLSMPQDSKSLMAMDCGKMMGIRVIGTTVHLDNTWFRPSWTNDKIQPTCATGGSTEDKK